MTTSDTHRAIARSVIKEVGRLADEMFKQKHPEAVIQYEEHE